MNDAVIIFALSVLMLLLLAFIFLYYYLYLINKEMSSLWAIIRIKLGDRLDKLPLLLEVSRYNGVENSHVAELIKKRAEAWTIKDPDKKRVRLELEISHIINSFGSEAMKNDQVKKDLRFLSQKKEIHELGKQIEELGETYNHKARGYNKKISFVLIRPFTKLFGFSKAPIFEFEP
jgi:hypothetical protein